ncbi:hypothetical protein [[Muricauda] lutisoli]|uniref:DUF4240 domain-containing protein n=1 Tax=[Muricauda] lutisoli TaxID=2816035 RepID=A0ABS3EU35_9FLAO|nr:hypothetical protein [[Muricauda] lutisoli]MBO0329760.1 hypothetical protein [[Muricauda] lutisoli]
MKKIDSKISNKSTKRLVKDINLDGLNQKLEEKIPEVEKRGGKTLSELEEMTHQELWAYALMFYKPFQVHPFVPRLKSGYFYASHVWEYLPKGNEIPSRMVFDESKYFGEETLTIDDILKEVRQYGNMGLKDLIEYSRVSPFTENFTMGTVWTTLIEYEYCDEDLCGRVQWYDDEGEDEYHVDSWEDEGETHIFSASCWYEEVSSLQGFYIEQQENEIKENGYGGSVLKSPYYVHTDSMVSVL